MTFHLNLPSEIRNNVLSLLIGCDIANGEIQNVFFDKREILAGVKVIRQERSLVKSCESSLIVEPHALPKSETDTPLWAPPGFGVINQKFDKIDDVLEIGLGD